jgi:hypothetical protein
MVKKIFGHSPIIQSVMEKKSSQQTQGQDKEKLHNQQKKKGEKKDTGQLSTGLWVDPEAENTKTTTPQKYW